jgi:F-type H+-transporting ATPase subunit delta
MTEAVRPPTVFDTDQQHVGGVYAKAVLGAAVKAGLAHQITEELDSFVHDVLGRVPALDATLASPRVPLETKFALLDKALAGRMSNVLLQSLKVICRHRRFDCIRAVRRALHEQYDKLLVRVEVQVQSAQPLTEELRVAVIARLEDMLGAEVKLVESVEPNLIGGLVVRVGDTVYDGSVANWLVRLRKEALEKTAETIKQALERFEVAE